MNVAGKILMICTTFNFPNELSKTIKSIQSIVDKRDDIICVMIDNFSKDSLVHKQLDQFDHDQVHIKKNNMNYGKAMAVNQYLSQILTKENCPRILISMDPDLEFGVSSFNQFIDVLDNVSGLGMISMRYTNNECNPERSIWFPPKKIKGNNGKVYLVRCPVFANVPGGFFAVQGYALSYYLNFKLFPKTKNEEYIKNGFIKRAGSDDAYLYDYLKKFRLIQGFVEGTEITHLKAPPQTKNYIK